MSTEDDDFDIPEGQTVRMAVQSHLFVPLIFPEQVRAALHRVLEDDTFWSNATGSVAVQMKPSWGTHEVWVLGLPPPLVAGWEPTEMACRVCGGPLTLAVYARGVSIGLPDPVYMLCLCEEHRKVLVGLPPLQAWAVPVLTWTNDDGRLAQILKAGTLKDLDWSGVVAFWTVYPPQIVPDPMPLGFRVLAVTIIGPEAERIAELAEEVRSAVRAAAIVPELEN